MKSTGIFWIREDFRIHNNPALSFATNNHDNVIALYIYNNFEFDNKREAQKWWLFKSLESIKKELAKFKINLEILISDIVNQNFNYVNAQKFTGFIDQIGTFLIPGLVLIKISKDYQLNINKIYNKDIYIIIVFLLTHFA